MELDYALRRIVATEKISGRTIFHSNYFQILGLGHIHYYYWIVSKTKFLISTQYKSKI